MLLSIIIAGKHHISASMVSIVIKHIGPVSDSGELRISPVTLLIGKQSSGKSTIMKILCYCSWVEKRIMVDGESQLKKYTHYNRFIKELRTFHHFDDEFFTKESEFHYHGVAIKIDYLPGASNVKITKEQEFSKTRHNEKISFIPSERNVVSAIQNVEKSYKASDYDVIFNYLLEYNEAKSDFTKEKPISVPFDAGMKYYYDAKEGDRVVINSLHHPIEPLYTSSGVQSALPLVIIATHVMNLAGATAKSSISDITNAISKILLGRDKDKNLNSLSTIDLKRVTSLINYQCSKLFVEEPEQNLFPISQYDIVRYLVRCLNGAKEKSGNNDNFMVMTTHSPYVLTSLNYLIKYSDAYSKCDESRKSDFDKQLVIPVEDFSAYALGDNGTCTDIVDREYNFISGDYLDSLSDTLNEKESELNDILYGDGEAE